MATQDGDLKHIVDEEITGAQNEGQHTHNENRHGGSQLVGNLFWYFWECDSFDTTLGKVTGHVNQFLHRRGRAVVGGYLVKS